MGYNKQRFEFGLPELKAKYGLQNHGKPNLMVGSTSYTIRWEQKYSIFGFFPYGGRSSKDLNGKCLNCN
jgi:hypothetical protein